MTSNSINHLSKFIIAWDDPHHSFNHGIAAYHISLYGNISDTDALDSYTGPVLTRWHQQFPDVIEPGIRDLVLYIVNNLCWITYSSCEGHDYGKMRVEPVERYIGVISRNVREQLEIRDKFRLLKQRAEASALDRAIFLEIHEHAISGSKMSVVDLIFRCNHDISDWSHYFTNIDAFYYRILMLLIELTDKE